MSGSTLQQVEKCKYLGIVVTSDERRIKEIDTRIGKANAVLRELYCFVVTKPELSNTTKLSVIESIFVPIHTYGHESWVMTKIIFTQKQPPEMGFVKRVHGSDVARLSAARGPS